MDVSITVNGERHTREVEPRMLLVHFLREALESDGKLDPVQEGFYEKHALQCGFCTPGMLMTATDLLRKYPLATDDEIREGLSGNLCRCTGYEHIVRAIRAVVGAGKEGGR